MFALTPAEKADHAADKRQLPELGENEGRNQLRILVLGESTSAPSHIDGVDVSWPAQAKLLLLASNPNYQIDFINLAQPGTSTAFQAEELFRRFDELQPNILVSMMGINDFIALALHEPVWWNSLRVVHFFRWLIQFLGCNECFQVSLISDVYRRPDPTATMQPLFKELHGMAAFDASKVELLTKKFERELGRQKGQPLLQFSSLSNFGSELLWLAVRDHKSAPQLRSAASSYFLQALKIDPYDPWTIDHLCQIQSDDTCLVAVERLIQAGKVPSNSILRSAIVYGGSRSKIIHQEAKRRGLKILDATPTYEATKSIYRQVATFAKNQGIPYFAMQYPTGSIDSLRSLFTITSSHNFKKFSDSFHLQGLTDEIAPDFNHITFVDNLNFTSPEVQANKTQYFSDMFARDQGLEFGHTTAKGHRLIAESITSAIQKHLAAQPIDTDHRKEQ